MATNQFKTFADTGAASIMGLATYLADNGPRSVGNQPNTTADPSLNNRALHQSTIIGEAFGILASTYSLDFLDDNATNVSNRISSILSAVAASAVDDAIRAAIQDGDVLSGSVAHNTLSGRNASSCHPMSAITGLNDALTDLQDKIDDISVVTVPDATTSVKGKVRLATQAEVNAGLDSETAITPLNLRATVFTAAQIPDIPASKTTSGVFEVDRIPGLDASKITSGTIDPARLPNTSTANISASQVTSGVFAIARIPDLDASKTTSGVFNIARIPDIPASKITGTLPTSAIPSYSGNIDASQVTSGTFAAARIPGIDASKITSGTIDPARLPGGSSSSTGNIDASQVVSGVLNVARIPSLAASKITSGTFDADRIPDLPASKTTTGVFDVARIPDIDASKVTSGTLGMARIPDLAASKITSGTFSADRIPSLDASKVTTGIFNAARIPNLDASKVTSGVFDIDRIPDIPSSKITGGTGGDIDASQVTSGVFDINRIPDIPTTKLTGRISANQLPTGLTLLSTSVLAWSSWRTDAYLHAYARVFLTSGGGGAFGWELQCDADGSITSYYQDGLILRLGLPASVLEHPTYYSYYSDLPSSDWGNFGAVSVHTAPQTGWDGNPFGDNSLTYAQRAPKAMGQIYGFTKDMSNIYFYIKLNASYSRITNDCYSFLFHYFPLMDEGTPFKYNLWD